MNLKIKNKWGNKRKSEKYMSFFPLLGMSKRILFFFFQLKKEETFLYRRDAQTKQKPVTVFFLSSIFTDI